MYYKLYYFVYFSGTILYKLYSTNLTLPVTSQLKSRSKQAFVIALRA